MTVALSKSKVDWAGRLLAEAEGGAEEQRRASDLVDIWRQMHAEPMEWVYESVRGRLARAGVSARLAQRLKRKPQIVSKLQRSSTRLSQMQDIAGCRALLPDLQQVRLAELSIVSRTGGWFEVRDVDDYREVGRADTGYRALHIKLARENRVVEVQLRTRLQHAWAEAVERAGERMGFPLKAGIGPDEVLAFFRLASDAFALVDRGQTLSRSMRATLRTGYSKVSDYLPPDVGPVEPARLEALKLLSRSNNWLIIYNWRSGTFERWMRLGTDAEAAAERYGEYERRYPYESGYEVVLIGADSAETLRHTHAHYFGRTPNDIDPDGYFAQIL